MASELLRGVVSCVLEGASVWREVGVLRGVWSWGELGLGSWLVVGESGGEEGGTLFEMEGAV